MDAGMDALRNFIVERRGELRISQVELAKRSGISSATIAAIEAGRVTRHPRFDTLEAIAKGLRVDVELLEGFIKGKEPGANLPDDPQVAELAAKILALPKEKREAYIRLMQAQLELFGEGP